MAQTKRRNRPKLGKKNTIAAVTLLLILAALLVFLYREEIFGSPGKYDEDSGISDSEPFTYENGSNQSFALMGKCLAIASSSGLQLLDDDGKTISRQVFSMDIPCVSAGGDTCVFYDVGGTALRVLFGPEEYAEMDTESPIIAVNVNSAGYFAVTTEESGFKGCVTVYDSSGEPIYKWYAGSGYALDAVVTPDNKRLAVLCVGESGSVLHFFRLTDEDEYSSAPIPAELCFEMGCSENGNIYVLSEKAIYFFDENGDEEHSFSFEDNYLVDYEFSESFCAVVLSKYISGSEVTITSFSANGRELGSAALPYSPVSLSSQKSKLLVFGTAGITVFSRDMDPIKESAPVSGYKSAVLMPDSDVMLLAAYHGEKITLK